jgi:large subunit ribosomal protein L6
MSRIGKKPVPIPAGVTVTVADGLVKVKGAKGGTAARGAHRHDGGDRGRRVRVSAERITRNPMFGTMRAQIANMVTGVTTGFSKTLEIVGTGFRANLDGKKLVLQLASRIPWCSCRRRASSSRSRARRA